MILPLAVRLAPLLSSCHWQLRLSPLVALFSALELDTVALLSGFKNLTVFSGFWGNGEPPTKDLHRVRNPNRCRISSHISIFCGRPSIPYWYTTTLALFLSALATNIHLSDPSPLRPVLRHRSSDGRSNPLGVFLLPAPAGHP